MVTSTLCQKISLFFMLFQAFILIILYYRQLMSVRVPAYQTRIQHTARYPVDLLTPSVPSEHQNNVRSSAVVGDKQLIFQRMRSSANGLPSKTSIAIGLAITTRKAPKAWAKDLRKLPFFHSLLPSFCKTASAGYDYRFYVAYDYNDLHLTKRSCLATMAAAFDKFTAEKCTSSSTYSLHFVKCSYTKKPAWAQNDAMIEAYLSGVEYFYRINDDTVMITGNWTERFINALDRFIPPRLGVVGPKHKGGNTAILTYDFTHRTHIDIHGFYYPREFPDWYADNWITAVYKPGRSIKLQDVLLVHTMESGQRYKDTRKSFSQVNGYVQRDRANVVRYAVAATSGFTKRDPRNVIAISLYNTSTDNTWGVIRNAQLMPIIYPGWSLKIYTKKSAQITDRIETVLRLLEVNIVFTDWLATKIPAQLWSYQVADEQDVEVFLIRHADKRLSTREFSVVNDWLTSRQESVFGIKDHPDHVNLTLIDGLWGARSKSLRSLLDKSSMKSLVEQRVNSGENSLLEYIFSKAHDDVVLYDSITCEKPHSVPFPVERRGYEYVGRAYNSHEQSLTDDKYRMLSIRNPKCEGTRS